MKCLALHASALLLSTALSPSQFSAKALQINFRPGYLHVMVDTRKSDNDVLLQSKLLEAAGVDSFLIDGSDDTTYSTSSGGYSNFLHGHQLRPICDRHENYVVKEQFTIWQVSTSAELNNKILSTDNKMEAFAVCGDVPFVIHAINRLLPPGANCLWWPPSLAQCQLMSKNTSPIDVWRLRSNPGISGIVLDANNGEDGGLVFDINNLGYFSARLRKLRQPCSAMDYPPTIFMVGEDEIR